MATTNLNVAKDGKRIKRDTENKELIKEVQKTFSGKMGNDIVRNIILGDSFDSAIQRLFV